jgi:hypothetical protein
MHILYAPDRRLTPKLRSFIDFAGATFGRAALSGKTTIFVQQRTQILSGVKL